MRRFFLPPEDCRGSFLTLTGAEAHHALRVLRLRLQDTVTVLDGAGGEYACAVAELGRDTVKLAARKKRTHPPLPCETTLVQAIPRGKIFDSIVQKATELGVARIVPLLSERVVTRLDELKAESRVDHWRAIAIESIKQCGSGWLPAIEPPIPWPDLAGQQQNFDLSLIASLQPDSPHPRRRFREYQERQGRPPRTLCLWIGPEGDFTPAELAAIQSAGGLPITFGPLVLRSETAAIYGLSIISYELQALD